MDAYDHENQLSPRVNAVWKPLDGTTFHAGYARYFTPPPFELVGNQSRCAVPGHYRRVSRHAGLNPQGRTR